MLLPQVTHIAWESADRTHRGQGDADFIRKVRPRFKTENPGIVLYVEHRAKSVAKDMFPNDVHLREEMWSTIASELYFAFRVMEEAAKLGARGSTTYPDDNTPVTDDEVIRARNEMRAVIDRHRAPKKNK